MCHAYCAGVEEAFGTQQELLSLLSHFFREGQVYREQGRRVISWSSPAPPSGCSISGQWARKREELPSRLGGHLSTRSHPPRHRAPSQGTGACLPASRPDYTVTSFP